MKSRELGYNADKAERLEARLSRKQKELFKHAADLSGKSLTNFVLGASQEVANRVIRENEIIALTAQESEKFVNALLNPPTPNAALKKAMRKHSEQFGDN